jgi:ABC-type transport system substrate-binding protein
VVVMSLGGEGVSQTLTDASQAEDPETTQSLMTEAFSVLSEEYVLGWLRSGMTFSGYTDDLQGFPGEPKDWGYEASSFFENADSSRLLGFREQ